MDKDPHHVGVVPQHIPGGPPHNDATALVRQLVQDGGLGLHGVLDHLAAQVELAQHIGGVLVQVGQELTVQPALLGGQGDHFLIIEGHLQLLGHQLADLFTPRPVLPVDGQDHAGAAGLQDRGRGGGGRFGDIVLGQELPVKPESHQGGHRLGHREGQPEPGQPPAGKQIPQRHKEHHRADHRQQGTFQAVAHGLEEDRENQRGDQREEADPDEPEPHPADVHHPLVGGKDPQHGGGEDQEEEGPHRHQRQAEAHGGDQGLAAAGDLARRVVEADHRHNAGLLAPSGMKKKVCHL